MILVIGDLARWRRDERALPRIEDIRFVNFAELGPSLLRPPPDLIISPLTGQGWDALEIGQRLQELGFRGRYRALAAPGTIASVVTDEVRQVAPDLDFDVIVLSPPEDAG